MRRARKHVSSAEWDAVTLGVPAPAIARRLRVHVRTVRDWSSGRRPVPWWAPTLLLLDDFVIGDVQRQVAGRLAVLGLPCGRGNELRQFLDHAVVAACRDAIDRGVAGALALLPDVPRQTLEAQRSSDLSDERGLTTLPG